MKACGLKIVGQYFDKTEGIYESLIAFEIIKINIKNLNYFISL